MADSISVTDLIKRYRNSKEPAVKGISFVVKAGEFFSFLGPNGAGKTTTISILNTTLAKTSGVVTVAGFDLDHQASDIRRNIGVIFQNPSFDINLTAEENIRLHALIYGLYHFRPAYSLMPTAYKERLGELSELLGIKDQIFQPVRTLSGGMKRKLEIVRSLMHHPHVLFLDEPTAGLDPVSRKNLWQYLKDMRRRERLTIFLTTHYLEEAEDSDRVCIINHGQIVVQGTPHEIKRRLLAEYVVIDASNRRLLIRELNKSHIPFTLDGHVKVDISHTSLQKIMQHIKTPLSYIQVHSPTLEDAYISIIQEPV